MSLRDRCKEMLNQLNRDAIMRQGSPVDDLMAFIVSEKGRASDDSLKDTLPVVLYFGNDADREEFMAVVHAAKPNLITKKLP